MAYNVGDVVTLDGIESVIIYDAGSEQEWGRYIVTDRYHNLYDYSSDEYSTTNYVWNTDPKVTNINNINKGQCLNNINQIIALKDPSYQPISGYKSLIESIKNFRNSHSDKWFIPSYEELALIMSNSEKFYNIFTSGTNNTFYFASSSEATETECYGFYDSEREKSEDINDNITPKTVYSSWNSRYRLCRYATEEELSKVIQITTTTPDSQIYYTVNDNTSLYSSPFKLTANQEIKAIAKKTGYIDSDETDFIYNSTPALNPIKVYNISYEVKSGGSSHTEGIANVTLNKNQAYPGEEINVHVEIIHNSYTFFEWSIKSGEDYVSIINYSFGDSKTYDMSFIMPDKDALVVFEYAIDY